MRPVRATLLTLACVSAFASAQTPAPFTLQQVLSAPYAVSLTAAPTGNRFAWVENAEGRRNIWIGSATEPARMLTHYTEDDGQDISSLAWSPDSSAIAYVYGAESGADGRPANPAHLQRARPVQIVVQPLASNATPVIIIGEGHAPQFTPDCRSLVFVRLGTIWIADLPSSFDCHSPGSVSVKGSRPDALPAPPHQLVFDRGTPSDLTLSSLPGHLLAFISHRRETNQPSHSFLALFDLKSHTLRFPAASTGDDLSPVFVDGDHYLAWLRRPFTETAEYLPHRVSPSPWSIQLLRLQPEYDDPHYSDYPEGYQWPVRTLYTANANRRGSVLPHMATGEPRLLFPDIGTVVFGSEADGWNHLYALKLDSSTPPKLLTPGPYEVEDPVIDRASHVIYYSSNDAAGHPIDSDRRHLWRLSLQPDAPYPYMLPQQVSAGSGIETRPHEAFPGIVAMAASAQEPMHPVFVTQQGALQPLRPDWLPATYPRSQLVTPTPLILRKNSARPIHTQLFLPPHLDLAKKHPALIFVHGGPRRQMLLGYPGMDYYSNAYAMNQYLASRGFIVFSVNYRGGIGYGLDFREAENYGPHGASEYNDVLAAVRYLRSRPDVDAKRIGIWGGSYGGYLTALALARNSDLFAAGVDFHGVHEWSLEDNAADWLRGTLPEQEKIAAVAHASSPMADVARWRSPVLFIHGDNDPEVAYAQTPTLADALRARKVPVEELIFPDELHGFLLHKDWLAAYEATAAFFERTLKPQQ